MYVIPLALLAGAAAGLFVRGSTDYFLATRIVFWPIPAVGVATVSYTHLTLPTKRIV